MRELAEKILVEIAKAYLNNSATRKRIIKKAKRADSSEEEVMAEAAWKLAREFVNN